MNNLFKLPFYQYSQERRKRATREVRNGDTFDLEVAFNKHKLVVPSIINMEVSAIDGTKTFDGRTSYLYKIFCKDEDGLLAVAPTLSLEILSPAIDLYGETIEVKMTGKPEEIQPRWEGVKKMVETNLANLSSEVVKYNEELPLHLKAAWEQRSANLEEQQSDLDRLRRSI